jgi:hypothetical protein
MKVIKAEFLDAVRVSPNGDICAYFKGGKPFLCGVSRRPLVVHVDGMCVYLGAQENEDGKYSLVVEPTRRAEKSLGKAEAMAKLHGHLRVSSDTEVQFA